MITKYLPETVTRAAGRTALRLNANAPKLLFVSGVVGAVGATVLACKATLKVEDVLIEHQKTMLDINSVQHEQYSEKDRSHDKFLLFTQTSITLVRLYGPSVIIGTLSIAALTKSHNLLQDRNAALSAAYAGLDATFGQYRERIRKELGEEKENELYRDAQVVKTTVDGKTVKVKRHGPNGSSQFAELYSADTNHNFHVGSHEANIMTLRQRENYLNDQLRMNGHLYLNEALKELGFDHTELGSTFGWLFKPEDPNHDGDNYVTFNCWTDTDRDQIDPLMMNNADGIFLDFNVDGEIHRRLDEVKPLWKLTDKAARRARRS